MESRNAKTSISKTGGNASVNSLKYKLTIPNSWAKEMGITTEKPNLNIYHHKNTIIATNNDNIEKLNIEMLKHNKDLDQVIEFTLEKLKEIRKIKKIDLAKIFKKHGIDKFDKALKSLDLISNEDENIYLDLAYDIMKGTLELWDSELSEEKLYKLYEENENFREDKEKEVWSSILEKSYVSEK